jgi:hypothetical protein
MPRCAVSALQNRDQQLPTANHQLLKPATVCKKFSHWPALPADANAKN